MTAVLTRQVCGDMGMIMDYGLGLGRLGLYLRLGSWLGAVGHFIHCHTFDAFPQCVRLHFTHTIGNHGRPQAGARGCTCTPWILSSKFYNLNCIFYNFF